MPRPPQVYSGGGYEVAAGGHQGPGPYGGVPQVGMAPVHAGMPGGGAPFASHYQPQPSYQQQPPPQYASQASSMRHEGQGMPQLI